MKKILLYILAAAVAGFGYSRQAGSELPDRMPTTHDSIPAGIPDTTMLELDTAKTRFTKINRDANDIKAPVNFTAKDSMVISKGNSAHL